MACILRDKTFNSHWLAKDIEPGYVDAFIYLMKGDWEKALSLISQVKYTPPDPINCRCTMIATEDSLLEDKYVNANIVKDPDNEVGKYLTSILREGGLLP